MRLGSLAVIKFETLNARRTSGKWLHREPTDVVCDGVGKEVSEARVQMLTSCVADLARFIYPTILVLFFII